MPSLTIAADIKAETWLGAAGCARGSQTCSGAMPAFEPNANSASAKTADAAAGEAAAPCTRSAAKLRSAPCPRMRNAASSAANPACVMTAYHSPAAGASSSAEPLMTSRYDETAISSQPKRKVMALPAAATRHMPARNALNIACTRRPRRARSRSRVYSAA